MVERPFRANCSLNLASVSSAMDGRVITEPVAGFLNLIFASLRTGMTFPTSSGNWVCSRSPLAASARVKSALAADG
jgi:hypothetical protein